MWQNQKACKRTKRRELTRVCEFPFLTILYFSFVIEAVEGV